jgi:hypothetical protein
LKLKGGLRDAIVHYNLVTINSKERNVELVMQGKTWAQTTQCAQCEGSKHHDTHPKPYWCMDGPQSEEKKKKRIVMTKQQKTRKNK